MILWLIIIIILMFVGLLVVAGYQQANHDEKLMSEAIEELFGTDAPPITCSMGGSVLEREGNIIKRVRVDYVNLDGTEFTAPNIPPELVEAYQRAMKTEGGLTMKAEDAFDENDVVGIEDWGEDDQDKED